MVFFFIACHKSEHSEEQLESLVNSTLSGAKPIGEYYKVQVITFYSLNFQRPRK